MADQLLKFYRKQVISLRHNRLTEERIRQLKIEIISAYENLVIRTYSYIRFLIMNMRILEELEQYLPHNGTVLDVGCGFGLFSFFFALSADERKMIGVDINANRIATAKIVREKLGLDGHIDFRVSDVADYPFREPVNAIVVLDLFHHVPRQTAQRMLERFQDILQVDGVLIIKDITAKPWLKMAFTWILDKMMDFRGPLHYYTKEEMLTLVETHGFDVKTHRLIDILPYPHVMYICRKTANE
ncbi:MAG: class I SAM-dependent methyltransferase [Chloroflexi bacterium]|nr:class I SAM-dependent methyltransferase [Chloroflexota bacterium]